MDSFGAEPLMSSRGPTPVCRGPTPISRGQTPRPPSRATTPRPARVTTPRPPQPNRMSQSPSPAPPSLAPPSLPSRPASVLGIVGERTRKHTDGPARDMELDRLEAQLATLEELGLRGRRGVKMFPNSPHAKSIVAKIVFSEHDPLEDVLDNLNDDYKQMYNTAAGRSSWVPHQPTKTTFPQTLAAYTDIVDLQGEDLDDLALKRGKARFAHFDQKSNLFDDVVFNASAGGKSKVTTATTKLRTTYTGAAGTPTWVEPAPRTKGSVSNKVRQKSASISSRFMARITQELKLYAPARKQDASSRRASEPASATTTPREPREIGPPASCGMARLARKRRPPPASSPWNP